MNATLEKWLTGWRPSRAQIDDFIGRYVTEPKPTVWFEQPARRVSPGAFQRAAASRGVLADRRTRMSYRGGWFFINGESCAMAPATAARLRRLADRRELEPEAFTTTAGTGLAAALQGWLDAGWLRLGPARPRPGSTAVRARAHA